MDLSKLPDSQRQELQKQFHDPFHLHQSYDPSHAYNHQSYYYPNPNPHSQSYYHNYYSDSYQQQQQPQHYTHSDTTPGAYSGPNEKQRNEELGSGLVGLGQGGQGQYGNLGIQVQPNVGYPGGPGVDAGAAAALSQLLQFAGAMGGPMVGDQGRFRPPGGPAPYRGGGRRGGGPFRGGGRGNSGFRPPNTSTSGPPFRGRGRGRGKDKRGRRGPPSSQPESSSQANAQPPARIAWCELCKVECTSTELLEQHYNGRRHKKTLQKSQQKEAQQPVVQIEKDAKTSSDTGAEEHKNVPENKTQVADDNNKVETVENDNQEKKHRMKRKMKGRIRGGGRGGAKRMRPAGPRVPKVVIPLMCDLCNVKCDTQEVFDRHVAGKKHMSKLKRFAGHQAMYGPTAVQALYPPNPLSQTLAPQPQPAYYGAPSSYPEAYIPPPSQAQNPNPQLADAPLEFGTQNAVTPATASNGVQ